MNEITREYLKEEMGKTRFEFNYFGATQARIGYQQDPKDTVVSFIADDEPGLFREINDFLLQYSSRENEVFKEIEMTKITLPGSISGLLRRGSPVTIHGAINGLVVDVKDEHESFVYCYIRADFFRNQELSLDLEDPTGRQHAIWWLAKTTKDGQFCPGMKSADIKTRREICKYWSLRAERVSARYWDCENDEMTPREFVKDVIVASLKEIDWENELEALRRICLHVAGLS